MKIKGILHWREDAKDMSFQEFLEFHKDFFDDESEAKRIYVEITGNPIKILKKSKDNIQDSKE